MVRYLKYQMDRLGYVWAFWWHYTSQEYCLKCDKIYLCHIFGFVIHCTFIFVPINGNKLYIFCSNFSYVAKLSQSSNQGKRMGFLMQFSLFFAEINDLCLNPCAQYESDERYLFTKNALFSKYCWNLITV